MDMINICDPRCLQCRFAHVTPLLFRDCKECMKILENEWKCGQIEIDKCGIFWRVK